MCRMCLIEIEGVPRLQAACNTPVKEGMGIITKSDRVIEARAGHNGIFTRKSPVRLSRM